MKIRSDFVTNSSSSSFVTISIYDPELARIINELSKGETLYCDSQVGDLQVKDDVVTFNGQASCFDLNLHNMEEDDERTPLEEGMDDNTVMTDYESIYSTVRDCLVDCPGESDDVDKIEGLIKSSVKQHRVMACSYMGMTDGYSDDFYTKEDIIKNNLPMTFPIEGTAYEGRNERIENVKVGDKLKLKAYKNSKYFESGLAIEVLNEEGGSLGYLSMWDDVLLARLVLNINKLSATVESVTPLSARRKGSKYALMDVKISELSAEENKKGKKEGTKKSNNTKKNKGNSVVFNDNVSFELPSDFLFIKEKNDEGKDVFSIKTGEYENDDGETCYKFTCVVSCNEVDASDLDEDVSFGEFFADSAEDMEFSRYINLPGSPEVFMINKGIPVTMLGIVLKMFSVLAMVNIGDWHFLQLGSTGTIKDDEPEENSAFYKNFYEVLDSIRINGKSLPLEGVTPSKLESALVLNFDGDEESIDLSSAFEDTIKGFVDDIMDSLEDDSFEKLNDTVSVSKDDDRSLLINGEWLLTLPKDIQYEIDKEVEIPVGSIFEDSVKPLVLENKSKGFEIGLDKHFHMLGTYYSVVDCRHDNLVLEGSATQTIVFDTDDFYVDVVTERTILGTFVRLRVRGEDISPYNFEKLIKGDDSVSVYEKQLLAIAKNIKPNFEVDKTVKRTKAAIEINDSNCIVNGTVLQKYIGKNKNIVLPDGITEVQASIFSGRDDITSLSFPDSVSVIGNRICENCFSLEKVDLPASIEYLGGYAFCDCHVLQSIDLGDSLERVCDSTFSECFELEDVIIPESVTAIEQFAFKNCRKFKRIVIPGNVKSIGFSAFARCRDLEYLYIPASVEYIAANPFNPSPFAGCEKLTVHCPSGSYAADFCKNNGINYVIDDSDVPTPKSAKARAAEQLETAIAVEELKDTISDLSSSLSDIAAYYGKLAEEKRKEEEEKIASGEYIRLDHKENSIIPAEYYKCLDRLAGIIDELRIFESYSPLKFADAETINEAKQKLINISNDSVDEYPYSFLVSVREEAEWEVKCFNDYYDQYRNNDPKFKKELIYGIVKKVDEIVEKYDYFSGNFLNYSTSDQEDMVIKSGALLEYKGNASNIVVPDGVKTVADTFLESQAEISEYRDNIISISIPKSVQKIEFPSDTTEGTFLDLKRISVDDDNGNYCAVDDVLFSKDMTKLIYYPSARDGEKYIVPEGVKTICKGAFAGKKAYLRSLYLSKDVELLDGDPFMNSDGITEFVMSDEIKTLGKKVSVFENDTLKTVHISNSIDHYPCILSKSIETINIPECVKEISPFSFAGKKLPKIYSIPNNIEIIESSAFENCASVEYMEFGENVKEIGKNAFKGCIGLKCVVLPEKIEKFLQSSFADCDNLEMIFAPKSVQTLSAVESIKTKYNIEFEFYEVGAFQQLNNSKKDSLLRTQTDNHQLPTKQQSQPSSKRKSENANERMLKSSEPTHNQIKENDLPIADAKTEKGQSSYEDIPAASKKEKKNNKAAIIVAVIIALLLLLYIVATSIIPTLKFNKAVELINNKQYSEAGRILKNWSSKNHRSDVNKLVDKYGIYFCEVGDVVYFGHSEVYGANDNQIRWKVIDKKDGKALLIMDNFRNERKNTVKNWKGIHMPFDDNGNAVWNTCTLNQWLNNDFYNNVFSDEEKEKAIVGETGSGVNEKVFVLSSSEFSHYFPASEMYDRYVSAFDDTFYSGWLRDGKYYCLKGSQTSKYLTADSYDTKNALTVYPAIWVDVDS